MSLRDLPDVFTIPEAAALLRIGRTTAYGQAQLWRATGGREGLTVLTLGRRLFVSKAQLERMLDGELCGNGPRAAAEPIRETSGVAAADATVSRDTGHGTAAESGAAGAASPTRALPASSPLQPEPSQLSLFNPESPTSNPSR